jgi:hypothetical protein
MPAAERAGLLPSPGTRFAAADITARALNGVLNANDAAARTAQRSANGPPSVAPRRRHAETATVSVILG